MSFVLININEGIWRMTERIFDLDAYISEFNGTVISCTKKDELYEVELDRTAFFPEGGGQDSDIGVINGESVIHVFDNEGIIVHLCKKKFNVGDTVHGKIDFKERFRRMQNHTGEHILSGVAHAMFGVNNIGFHLSEKYIRIDYDKNLTSEEAASLEFAANEKIWNNLNVNARYPDKKELENIFYRSKKEINGAVRIVTIEDTDVCACCAPHVRKTGEVGCIKILSCTKYKIGCRIEAVCGIDAYKTFTKEHEILSQVARESNVKREEVIEAFERLKAETIRLKHYSSYVENKLMMQNLSILKETDGNFCFFSESSEVSTVRTFVNEAVKFCKGVCAVFFKTEKEGYRFIVASENVNLKDNCKIISEALSAKCGGSSSMIQGSTAADKETISEFFENYIF